MFDPESYTTICHLLPRLLGFIYFVGIGAFLLQIQGLIGSKGILPLADYLSFLKRYYPKQCYLEAPTLFWINSSDKAITAVASAGTISSVMLMLGYYPALLLLLLYVIHLSLVTAGQDFMSFGWEGLLLEITFQTFWIALTEVPSLMIWISLNFLLFRFHLQAGTNKLTNRDPNWRNLTAVAYHYQSQPLPNAIAWYAYKLPLAFQKLSTLVMFFIEIAVPFALFLGEAPRLWAFVAFFSLQYFIWLTGNFSYLNYLTVALISILLSNSVLSTIGITSTFETTGNSFGLELLVTAVGTILLTLQVMRLWHHFLPNRQLFTLFRKLAPYHLVNTYTLFASMTTERFEIIIEGSEDGTEWKEYLFSYKPSEVTRRPRRIAPYQPRLDWQAWFLPFRDFESEEWFQKFLVHLLKGTPSVLKLLRGNPFPKKPPKFVRSLLYVYEFTSYDEKKTTGCWWKRTLIGAYSPTLALKEPIIS